MHVSLLALHSPSPPPHQQKVSTGDLWDLAAQFERQKELELEQGREGGKGGRPRPSTLGRANSLLGDTLVQLGVKEQDVGQASQVVAGAAAGAALAAGLIFAVLKVRKH